MDIKAWQEIRRAHDRLDEVTATLAKGYAGESIAETRKRIDELETLFKNEIQGLKMRIGKVKP